MRLGIDYAPVVKEGIPDKRDGLAYYNKWWDEQRLRIQNGWTTPWGEFVCKQMYFYLNFGTILGFAKSGDVIKQLIRPKYLDGQHGLYLAMQDVIMKQKERLPGRSGLVIPKGRRKGVSWLIANEHVRLLIAEPNSVGAVGSDGEVNQGYVADHRLKVKSIYNQLPSELKSNIDVKKGAINNVDMIRSQYKENVDGNDKLLGMMSELHFRNTSNPNCFKGLGINFGYIEEAGEVMQLLETIGESSDCFKEGDFYYGLNVVAGTSNKISHETEDFQKLCLTPEKYDFSVYFFPAQRSYYPFYSESSGKSDEQGALKSINDEIERLKASGDTKKLWSFIQNNPTSLEAMFNVIGESKFNLDKIRAQAGWLLTKPSVLEKLRTGRFEWKRDPDGRIRKDMPPIFIEDPYGHWEIYDEPYAIPGFELSAIDSYYLSSEFGGGSESDSKGAMTVYRGFIDMQTPCEYPVAQYHHRPASKEEWYEETAKGNAYYRVKRKCLVEYNDEEILRWYINNGFENMLMLRPTAADAPYSQTNNRYGVHLKEHQRNLIGRLMGEYVENSVHNIFFIGLLNELAKWGMVNTDRAVTFGLCLLADFSLKTYVAPKGKTEEVREEIVPRLVDVNGVPTHAARLNPMGQIWENHMRNEKDRWSNLG